MKFFLKNNAPWLLLYTLILVAMVAAIILLPKGDIHLALNAYHAPWLDGVMRTYTLFVVWPVYVLIALLLFYKAGWTAFVAIAEAVTAVVVHIIKPLVNMPRPLTFFTETEGDSSVLQLVDGVDMKLWWSFPSGHTAAFFAFFVPLILLMVMEMNVPTKGTKSRGLQVTLQLVLLLLALLGGYTRIYLSQHFLLDVCVGSVLAVVVALITYWLFAKYYLFDAKWFAWRITDMKKK